MKCRFPLFAPTFLLFATSLFAQTDTSHNSASHRTGTAKTDTSANKEEKKPSTLVLSADVRVRAELRHGYRNVAIKDTAVAFFVNQRSRINLDVTTKRFSFYASLQDARVWGQQDPRAGQGTPSATATSASVFPLYFFELYAEPRLNDKWSVRIGRQRIMYDNQRLFAENDWRLAGNSHDAVRIIYNNKKNVSTELVGAYNQSAENTISSNYAPNGFANYKDLLVHYLNWKLSPAVTTTVINSMDGYQSATVASTTFQRFTSGGRVAYEWGKWYATASAFYQYGKDSSGKALSAYYLQPEIKYASGASVIRLGMEYLSGQSAQSPKDNSFVPLYGVAHRFNGSLDFFTTYPADTRKGGLVNPYFIYQYKKEKLTLRVENHLFYSQTSFPFKDMPVSNRYLGYENDWRVNYKINGFTDLEAGFSWAAITPSFLEVKNHISNTADMEKYARLPYWSYVSIRFTPSLGSFTF